jgi:hypothetical protein
VDDTLMACMPVWPLLPELPSFSLLVDRAANSNGLWSDRSRYGVCDNLHNGRQLRNNRGKLALDTTQSELNSRRKSKQHAD